MSQYIVHAIYYLTYFPTCLSSMDMVIDGDLSNDEIIIKLKGKNGYIGHIKELDKHILGNKEEFCCLSCCQIRINDKQYSDLQLSYENRHLMDLSDKKTCIKCKRIGKEKL